MSKNYWTVAWYGDHMIRISPYVRKVANVRPMQRLSDEEHRAVCLAQQEEHAKVDEKRYRLTAQYMSERELVVRVQAGDDPRDPSAWIEIESEHETDFNLYDVTGDAVEVDDQDREISD